MASRFAGWIEIGGLGAIHFGIWSERTVFRWGSGATRIVWKCNWVSYCLHV